jgi:hypothetical protein
MYSAGALLSIDIYDIDLARGFSEESVPTDLGE